MSSDTTNILAELSQIRHALYVIGALVVLTVALTCVRVYFVAKRELDSKVAEAFRAEAEQLLEKGELERLVSLGLRKLRESPNNVLAHWYLARGFYLQEKWSAALAEFEIVRKLHPAWNDEHIAPYVAEIKKLRGE